MSSLQGWQRSGMNSEALFQIRQTVLDRKFGPAASDGVWWNCTITFTFSPGWKPSRSLASFELPWAKVMLAVSKKIAYRITFLIVFLPYMVLKSCS